MARRRRRRSNSVFSCENLKDYMEHYTLVDERMTNLELDQSSSSPPPKDLPIESQLIIPSSKTPLSPIESLYLEHLFGISQSSSLIDSLALEEHPKCASPTSENCSEESGFQEGEEEPLRRIHLHERPRNFPVPIIPPTPIFSDLPVDKNRIDCERRILMEDLKFVRKTPDFVPRMMTEDFERINKCIEKRKIDIRELLKRVESAKHQHRRFSEHLQSAQNLTGKIYWNS
ncbi:unnamed protein product [Caenorhabditis angaria]|uniref:Uncharacterized protein n=1 Tax=Caenorhabditis angaria TaxID=860376 RepID=A0A9P1IPY1_9PELO|nr:unnamed protein product [Caenorhabditis angaria]